MIYDFSAPNADLPDHSYMHIFGLQAALVLHIPLLSHKPRNKLVILASRRANCISQPHHPLDPLLETRLDNIKRLLTIVSAQPSHSEHPP